MSEGGSEAGVRSLEPAPVAAPTVAAAATRPSGTNARFGRRFAALLYDSLLLVGLAVAFTFLALAFNHGKAVEIAVVGAWIYLYRAGLIGMISAYYLVNWTRSGQTLGMSAWHLRAVSERGQPLTWKAAALRLVLGWLAWAPAALGVLWLYVDRDGLALHDRLSHTRVVRLEGR
ncbi:MAG TPA: RDD family protein [Steroidobacteraceae bacterium]|nr:RDD family protein [Steroidobacteraceae bacterium]